MPDQNKLSTAGFTIEADDIRRLKQMSKPMSEDQLDYINAGDAVMFARVAARLEGLETSTPERFPLILHPDGTDTLYCNECKGTFYDGEDDRHLGDDCAECVPAPSVLKQSDADIKAGRVHDIKDVIKELNAKVVEAAAHLRKCEERTPREIGDLGFQNGRDDIRQAQWQLDETLKAHREAILADDLDIKDVIHELDGDKEIVWRALKFMASCPNTTEAQRDALLAYSDYVREQPTPLEARLADGLRRSIQWLRRIQKEFPSSVNPDSIDKHLQPLLDEYKARVR